MIQRRQHGRQAEIPPSARKWPDSDTPDVAARIAESTGMRLGRTIVASTNIVQTSAASNGKRPAEQQRQNGRGRGQRPTQIVDHLPAADPRQSR